MTERIGVSFETSEVVDLYPHRPAYPDELFEALVRLAPAQGALLDLGCGHGKIARPLARRFDHVTAIDPSARMIALGRSLPNGAAPNIAWIEGLAEETAFPGETYDLVVAALSIHWMDHDRLFPRLKRHVRPDHIFAVISGDQAFDPPWQKDWQAFLARWVPKITGEPLEKKRHRSYRDGYRRYVDVIGERDLLSDPISQSLDDFVKCQHSRDTFAYSKLGDRAPAFDSELRGILQAHAVDGALTFRVKTTLSWGTIAG
ncbi:class I SAM-dependent methyltransferase [Pelagibius litoralis]|uniref:Class I SAM-dependent methyltransferase n=1 Tax=Pelagibius litoralis TaxID=374515 RepID=A0A967EWT0_9PROT|nr:class I SAM-dependent methyltransferase [Pelagibius litoralis]NIA68193.1 class I SAM-dependent methyltransferase [Pelagibius litoralis]